jgi:hypothetical protein
MHARERAVEFGIFLPDFRAHDVDLGHYRRQPDQREQQKHDGQRKKHEERRQPEQQQQQKEQQKRGKTQKRKEGRIRQKLRKQQDPQNRQQPQPQQRINEPPPPPDCVITLPPVLPQLYPPPGPREQWSQQQKMDWEYQLYIQYQQTTYQHEDQEYQDQHRQWQQYYRQHQLQYWHRQEAQRFSTLAPFAVPANVDQADTSASPKVLVDLTSPVAVPPRLIVDSLTPCESASGLSHGLPVPQSSFASDGVTWPVLGEADFAKMMHEQQEQQSQQEAAGQDHVRKCEYM